MKKTISEQIEQMLEHLMSLSPNAVEAFFQDTWNPFIESLPSESDKISAYEMLWQLQVRNLKLIAGHIPGLPDAEFNKIAPQLQSLVQIGQSNLKPSEEAAAPAV